MSPIEHLIARSTAGATCSFPKLFFTNANSPWVLSSKRRKSMRSHRDRTPLTHWLITFALVTCDSAELWVSVSSTATYFPCPLICQWNSSVDDLDKQWHFFLPLVHFGVSVAHFCVTFSDHLLPPPPPSKVKGQHWLCAMWCVCVCLHFLLGRLLLMSVLGSEHLPNTAICCTCSPQPEYGRNQRQ